MKNRWFLFCIRWMIFFVIAVLVLGYVVMKLWNWIMPDLFSVGLLSYPKALGLLVLTRILFGGFKTGYKNQCRKDQSGGKWRKKFENKLNSMTPEERERFKENYYNKCGGWTEKECE